MPQQRQQQVPRLAGIRLVKPFMPTDKRMNIWSAGSTEAFEDFGHKGTSLRKRTVSGWEGTDPREREDDGIPTFSHRLFFSGGPKIRFEAHVDGTHLERWKWQWLSFGTRVNYARMTMPFSPKTSHRQLSSSPGVGGFSHLSFPAPGIRARRFDDEIARITVPGLFTRLKRSGQQALRAGGEGRG